MAALTKSADVQGMHLVGRDAVKLGVVRELFVDLETGRAEYLIRRGDEPARRLRQISTGAVGYRSFGWGDQTIHGSADEGSVQGGAEL